MKGELDSLGFEAAASLGDAVPSGVDSDQLADVLERYVAQLERGEAPPVDEVIASYPELAAVLPEYLDGVRLIHQAMAPPEYDQAAVAFERRLADGAVR